MSNQVKDLDVTTIIRIANNVAESVRRKFGDERTDRFLADKEIAHEFLRQIWLEIRSELEREG